mgnify:CR=1 FL=1
MPITPEDVEAALAAEPEQRRGGYTDTDSLLYGGSGVGNLGAVQTEDRQWHGQPVSVALRVPPLGALWLRPA